MRHRRLGLLLGGLVFLPFHGIASGASSPDSVRLQFENAAAGRPGTVCVSGLPAEPLERLWRRDAASGARLLCVRVDGAGDDWPCVLGSCRVEDGSLCFVPRFPFQPGLSYTAHFDVTRWSELAGVTPPATGPASLHFTVPEILRGQPPEVRATYPSGLEVPENLLRLYVVFSRPMRRKNVHSFVHLYDDQGHEVSLAFVEIRDGLWDPEARRLTLFMHPGRIKRGVGPHETMGPPLHQGRSYRLVIDANLCDATGQPLGKEFERVWQVGPADRTRPDPALWQLTLPESPTAPLLIDSPEPLDQALFLRWVQVEDPAGTVVPGEATLLAAERRWHFVPEQAWRTGTYRLVIHPALEDVAGNTPVGLFDRDMLAPKPPKTDPPARLTREFQLRWADTGSR